MKTYLLYADTSHELKVEGAVLRSKDIVAINDSVQLLNQINEEKKLGAEQTQAAFQQSLSQGYQEGYQRGFAEALEFVKLRADEALARVEYDRSQRQDDVVQTAIALIRKIAPSFEIQALLPMLNRVFSELDPKQVIAVRVPPNSVETVKSFKLERQETWEIIVDPELSSTDCLIELSDAILDVSFDAQLTRIERRIA
jgi:flagellar biosynthesis/type III secretory pathway protein FliH